MGAIPIIQHSPLDPLFVDLPVILIHHWDEVTPDFLKAKYHELERKEFKMEKIYIDYWLDLIRSYKKI